MTDVFVNDPPAFPGPALSWKPGEPPVGQSALPHAAPPPRSALPDYAPYGGANITGLALSSSDYVSSRLAGEAAAKGEAQTYVDRRAEDQMAQDRQKMAQSYDLEAADARDPALRPWNAEQEKARYIRGPMENFGSVGMIFAMAASAFTRTPMISALNAGAAAMQATAQSDEKAYKQAFDAWKSNSDLALKRFDMERNLYEDANKLLTTDMGLWKQKSLMLAAQFDNQKMRIMLENGMDKEVLDAQAAQFKAAEEMRKHAEGVELGEWKRQVYKESYARYKETDPKMAGLRALQDAISASKGEVTPDQRMQMFQQKEESVLQRAQLSANTRLDLARLSDATKREIAERMETGRENRAELSAAAREDIAKLNAESRTEIQTMLEGGRNVRAAQAEEGRNARATATREGAMERLKLSQDGLEKRAQMNISAREELQIFLEGGREARDIRNEAGRDRRTEMSDNLRREIAQMSSKDRKAIFEEREANLKVRAEAALGKLDQKKVGPATDAVAKAAEEGRDKAAKGDFGTPPDLGKLHDWEAARAQQIYGEGKFFPVDQAIVGELKNYPGKKREDLNYIDKGSQNKLESTFTSRENLERIAQYTKANPEAIGFVADLEKRMNLDKYQDLFNKANGGDKNAQNEAKAAVDSEFDRVADNRLQPSQAAKAKILNKMLTTQAFADAAIAGSRGGTIYLDRAFREIYDQASSPSAFYGVLRERYIDANNYADKYGLGFDGRSDKDKQPFWERYASPSRQARTAKPIATAIGPGGKRLGLVNGQWVPIP